MSEIYVLHLEAFCPEDEEFGDELFLKPGDNIRHYINDNVGYRLSIIIYYDIRIEQYIVFTDNITYTISDPNTDIYNCEHKYNRFHSSNIDNIYLLLIRMGSWSYTPDMSDGVYGKYNLHKVKAPLVGNSFETFMPNLTDQTKMAYLHSYGLSNKTISLELKMMKEFTESSNEIWNV